MNRRTTEGELIFVYILQYYLTVTYTFSKICRICVSQLREFLPIILKGERSKLASPKTLFYPKLTINVICVYNYQILWPGSVLDIPSYSLKQNCSVVILHILNTLFR